MKTTILIAAVAVAAVIAVAAVAVSDMSEEQEVRDEVTNESLNITGISDGSVVSFKGIPFAEAPVGDLRFAPPVPKAPWTETLDCTEYRDSAIQGPDSQTPDVSEDCLYLNVWAPADAKPGDKLPVYVWIHGGGFMNGSGNMSLYSGEVFAEEGIIAVTVNYRLGMLGYLYSETLLEEYGVAGNCGTLDHIMALEWVRDNIAAFGGDAGNVTIGGESAGSVSVCNLVLCREADGLFAKAIMESGTIANSFMPMIAGDPAKSLEMTGKLFADLGLKDDREGLETLRGMDPLTLWSFSSLPSAALVDKPYSFMPIYDGRLLPSDPMQAYIDGDYNRDVKVMIGTNANEGDVFSTGMETEKDWQKFLYHTWHGDAARKAIDSYSDDTRSAQEILNETVGLTFFGIASEMVQDAMSDNGSTVYAYEFDYTLSNGIPPIHASEICFAFGSPHDVIKSPTDADRRVSAQMNLMWVNFIANGDPNTGAGLPFETEWQKYDSDERMVFHFDTEPWMGDKTLAGKISELKPYFTA